MLEQINYENGWALVLENHGMFSIYSPTGMIRFWPFNINDKDIEPDLRQYSEFRDSVWLRQISFELLNDADEPFWIFSVRLPEMEASLRGAPKELENDLIRLSQDIMKTIRIPPYLRKEGRQ